MKHWSITDKRVIEAIRMNGFTCEKPKSEPIPGAITFYTRTLEEEREMEEKSSWYDTNCPIGWNETYTLQDGTVIRSQGTQLLLVEEEHEQTTFEE